MRVGIDLDGTITANPEFFERFLKAFMSTPFPSCGTKNFIFVLTGRLAKNIADEGIEFDPPHRVDQLKELGISVDDITIIEISRMHYIDIAKAKGFACRELEIDLVIEDNQHYIAWIHKLSLDTQCLLMTYNPKANLDSSH